MKVTEVSKGVVIQQPEQGPNILLPAKSVFKYQLAPDALDNLEYWDFVVGSSAQVTGGTATHASIQEAINDASAQNSILILRGSYTENLVIPKELFIQGQGRGTLINGTVEFQAGAALGSVQNLKFGNNLTFDSGTVGIFVLSCFQANGFNIIDGGVDNNIDIYVE